MMWRDKAICRTRPSDWWETGDDGNRLAMTLCRIACPVLTDCAAHACDEAGVVRAGTAYADTGRVLTVCPCGRPVIGQSAKEGYCRTCEPPAVHIRLRRPGRPSRYRRNIVADVTALRPPPAGQLAA